MATASTLVPTTPLHAGADRAQHSRRRLAIRVLSLLGLVALGFLMAFVLTDAAGRVGQPLVLEPAGSPAAQHGAEHPGEAVHLVVAASALVFAAAGLLGLAIRPGDAGFAAQSGAAVLAWLLAALVAGNPDNHGGQAGAVDPAFVVLAVPALAAVLLAAPWRAWRGERARPRFLLLAAAGLPWIWFGLGQGLMQRHTWPPLADPHHQAHWFMAALLGFLLVLAVAGAALPGRGRLVAAATAGVSSVAVATASLLAPEAASALPTAWAAAAGLWGTAVIGLGVAERRTPGRQPGRRGP